MPSRTRRRHLSRRAGDQVPVSPSSTRTVLPLGSLPGLVTGQERSGLFTIARNLARLQEEDIEEIEALVDLKISRQDKQEAVDEVQENA